MRTIHDLSENFSDGLLFPKGTSAERGNPEAGYFRYNTETKGIEVYDGTSWSSMDNTPSYVTDGLVLNLDAGNLNSYAGSGATWSDLAQDGNDGTINGATYTSNSYFTFDGSNNYIDLGNVLDFTTSDFSLAAWVNFNSVSDYQVVLQKGRVGEGTNTGYRIRLENNGQVNFVTNGINDNEVDIQSTTSLSTHTWYYITASRSGSNHKLYLNAVLEASTSSGDASSLGNNLDLVIGYNKYSSIWGLNGNLSIVNVYNKALSSDEITQNFNATKTRFGL